MYDYWDYDCDRFDGRDEFDHCGHEADMAPCFDCTDEADCDSCTESKAWLEENDELDYEEELARAAREDNPDSPDYVPF